MYIVAEIGVNHDGLLSKAIELIDKAIDCGCSAVKFQSFYADRLVHKLAQKVEYQKRSGDASESHYEMIKKLEFNGKNLEAVIDYSKKVGIDFITTPYDPISIKESYELGVRKFKTASADLSDPYIHNQLSSYKDIDVIIATGMSNIDQIKYTLKKYIYTSPILLHCVSDYPCCDESLNLNSMDVMQLEFPNSQIGLSDHSIGNTASLISATKGYTFFERHFTLNKNDNGPDHKASSNINEMSNYVFELNRVKIILGNKNKQMQPNEISMSKRSKKAIIASRCIEKGEEISIENTSAIRPAEEGISVDYSDRIFGRKAQVLIKKDTFLVWDMID